MSATKQWMLGVGIGIFCVGLMCFPIPIVSPKYETSFWAPATRSGSFLEYGFILCSIGIVIVLIALILPQMRGPKKNDGTKL